ncbi:MAG: lipoprotein-releasing ABC transporter permease subunit [candidate division Zixibacteria bacterium]|nr:lipoprotein-releasing ABC transporter permease subunit [candidate division Zixibacteria bacterium]
MRYEFFIASRYMMSREKSRIISVITFISIAGIAVGVAALVIVLSVMNGFESGIREKIIGITSHITVTAYEGDGIKPTEEIFDNINSVPGVVASMPVVQGKVAVSSRYSADGVMLRGVDKNKIGEVSDVKSQMILGEFDFGDKEEPGIVIGFTLADNLGVTTGSRLKVFSLSDNEFDPLTARPLVNIYTVKGIFETGMFEYDASLVYIDIKEAQWMFSMDDKVSFIDVKTENIYKAKSIAEKVNDKLDYRFFASDWSRTHKNLFSWMTLEKWAMFIALSLIIAVAGINIISNLIMVVLEKRKDIGILQTMGATKSSIKAIFLAKGLIVSMIGILIGLILGVGLCLIQDEYAIISLPAEIYFISELPVEINIGDIAAITLVALAVTFVASLYPASRAASLTPAQIIRYG